MVDESIQGINNIKILPICCLLQWILNLLASSKPTYSQMSLKLAALEACARHTVFLFVFINVHYLISHHILLFFSYFVLPAEAITCDFENGTCDYVLQENIETATDGKCYFITYCYIHCNFQYDENHVNSNNDNL